jgi:short chain dehydrogenase
MPLQDRVATVTGAGSGDWPGHDAPFSRRSARGRRGPQHEQPGSALRGGRQLSGAVMPIMLSAGRGVIINTASVGGIAGARAGAACTASKHGLIGLTRNICATYGRNGTAAWASPRAASIRASAYRQNRPVPVFRRLLVAGYPATEVADHVANVAGRDSDRIGRDPIGAGGAGQVWIINNPDRSSHSCRVTLAAW